MPEIRNCPRCGRIFTYINRPICSRCIEEEEQEFKKVKEYIYDNPGANITEVSIATEVTADKIMRFLREERLELRGDVEALGLDCERCGIPIRSGRFCEKCKEDIRLGFRKEFGLDKRTGKGPYDGGKQSDRMYTATRRKND